VSRGVVESWTRTLRARGGGQRELLRLIALYLHCACVDCIYVRALDENGVLVLLVLLALIRSVGGV